VGSGISLLPGSAVLLPLRATPRFAALQPRQTAEESFLVLQMPAHMEFIARGSRGITEQEI